MGEDNGKNMLVEEYGEEKSEDFSRGTVPDELHNCVMEAADACPVQAITVFKK
jgi:ferredoxin